VKHLRAWIRTGLVRYRAQVGQLAQQIADSSYFVIEPKRPGIPSEASFCARISISRQICLETCVLNHLMKF
jgi:hypothetical protein